VALGHLGWRGAAGYLAGTVNPLVETKPQWWDLLCDVDHGKVRPLPSLISGYRVGERCFHPRRNG